jgi:hypothetical protein
LTSKAVIELAMETLEVDIFKSRTVNKVRGVIESYFTADKADFADDLMDALDVEKLPSFDVVVTLKIGKEEIKVPGFEAEEKEEADEDEDE